MSSSPWNVKNPVQVLISKYPDLEADVIEQVFLKNRCHMKATESSLREMGAVPKDFTSGAITSEAQNSGNSTESRNYLPLAVTLSSETTSHDSGSKVQGRRVQIVEESDDDVIEISTRGKEGAPLNGKVAYEATWMRADTLRAQLFNSRGTLLSYYNLHKQSQETQTLAVKRLILLRGLPGSGKSTRAKAIVQQHGGSIFSADQYFTDSDDGSYRYQKELIPRAHLWNRTRAQNAASQGVSPIIIDNTNTMMKEMKPYIGIARHFGYIVEIEEMKTPWAMNPRDLARRNVHGVDETKIRLMKNRYQNINKDDVMTAFCRMPSPNKFKNSLASEENQHKDLVSTRPNADFASRATGSSAAPGDDKPATSKNSDRNLADCPPVVVPKPPKLKQVAPNQPRAPSDAKVQDWMAAQLSNLSVTAAEFRPTPSTFIPGNTLPAYHSEPQENLVPPNEDEKTLLSIFPNQSLENVRNLLIGNNGNMDASIEILCDLAEDDFNINPPGSSSKVTVFANDSPTFTNCGNISHQSRALITVPPLKSLALKVVDESLAGSVMGPDALVIINSSMSLHEKSQMNILGPNVKTEDLDEEQTYIDILDSDDSDDDENSNDVTVIHNEVINSTLIATDDNATEFALDNRPNLSSTLKPPNIELPPFDCPLPPELTSHLINLFGTFPLWEQKRSVSMSQSLLQAIYEAWRNTPVSHSEHEMAEFLAENFLGEQTKRSVIDLTSPVKSSPVLTANEFTLIDISTSSIGSPAASEKSLGASPKAKRQKRTKGPRIDLGPHISSATTSSRGAETLGSRRSGISLYEIMDEEERAEKSENAQKQALFMAAAIDKGQTSGDTAAGVMKMNTLKMLFPDLQESVLTTVLQDFNLKDSVQILSLQFGEPSAERLTTAKRNPHWVECNLQSTSSYCPEPVLGATVDPDRSFQTLVRPDYVDYRAESNMYRDLRQRELEKAMHATGPDKAAKREHYARNAFEYGELMKEANQRAALLTLERNKEARGGALDELDLHKLHVEEALVAVKNHLAELTHPKQRGKYNKLRIITGWGKNTHGPARIKPEVIKLLRKERLKFVMENIGSILVYLK